MADHEPLLPALPATTVLAVVKAVLADPAFTAAEAKVIVAIVCQANSGTGLSWTSHRQLKDDFHLGGSRVKAAIQTATGRYLEQAGIGLRGAVCYRILIPTTASAPTTGAAIGPVVGAVTIANAPTTGVVEGAALPLCPSSAPSTGAILVYTGEKKNPPTPREDAGGVSEISPAPVEDAEKKAPDKKPETTEEAIAKILKGYRQVFGDDRELPRNWRRKIQRGWSNGDRCWLAEVDEAAIRGGITLAKGMGQNGNYQLGLGHVRNCLEARAAVRQSQAKAQEAASAAQAQADSRKRAEQERRESDAAKRREHFASLPSKHQELYRQAARSEKYAPKGDDQRSLERIEAMAVELAWRSRMPEEAMA